MKVYLDDVRPAYTGWVLVRNVEDAKKLLLTGEVTSLSLDHDLGMEVILDDRDESGVVLAREVEAPSGYDLACWIEEYLPVEKTPKDIRCHSANPVGAARIRQAIEAIRRRNAVR